jgi:general secretion pathway protein D
LTKNIKVDKGGNRLICYASPRVIGEIERIVRAIDKPHILVLLETRLIEVSADKLNQYGFRYDLLNITESPGDIGTFINLPEQPAKNAFSFNGATRGEMNISTAISLMVQNGDGRVLMDSKLTTTNNREASLHIGEIVPYTIQSYNLSSSGGVNQQIEKENVGVILKMTPHINDKNQITLSLAPEVSSITGWKGASADVPVVRTRKTNTTVRVEDGQTVILAGLLSEERTHTIYKVPILGQIPVLGLLFQHKREEVKKSNLIIEVVPRIIHDPAEISKYMSMQLLTDGGKKGKRRGSRRSARVPEVQAAPAVQPAPAAIAVEPEPEPEPEPVAEPVPAPAPAAPEPAAE